MENEVQNETYFESYENVEIHELMLLDKPRNRAYSEAIKQNADFFKNKVVLDVGTGTGLLAIMCAKAGARKVFAVEASNLAVLAQKVIEENKCDDKIEVIHKRVEEVALPEKVDIIISEWMGFYLLHEGMLDSILFARDQFLKEDGKLFPEIAKIYAAPSRIPSMYEYWNNVHGVSMQSFAEINRKRASSKPEILVIQPDHLISKPECISYLDLSEITSKDLDLIEFTHIFVTEVETGLYQGLVLWFEVEFPNMNTDYPICLSTGPESEPTHWKQTVLLLQHEIPVEKGEPIAVKLRISRDSEYRRRYDIEFELEDAEQMEHPLGCGCYMTKCILSTACLNNMGETITENS